MMIMMAPEATEEQITNVVARLDATGTVHAKVVPGAAQVAIAAIGDAAAVRQLGVEALTGVPRFAAGVLAHAAFAGRTPAHA